MKGSFVRAARETSNFWPLFFNSRRRYMTEILRYNVKPNSIKQPITTAWTLSSQCENNSLWRYHFHSMHKNRYFVAKNVIKILSVTVETVYWARKGGGVVMWNEWGFWFLVHLSRRLKWAFLITICPLSIVVFVVVVVINFSHFHLLQTHWTNFNET